MEHRETYNNLIDVCLALDEDKEVAGKTGEIFRKILMEYFFKNEVYESKKMETFFRGMEMPAFLNESITLVDVDIQKLAAFIEGGSFKDSLCGKIMLSSEFLKSFYPHHSPSFNKIPGDVQEEIVRNIKDKNALILAAFRKMKSDREADRNRKVLTLVALVLKNIHLKTGLPFNKLDRPSEEIIRSFFSSADDAFKAQRRQMSELNDDKKIKDLIKVFFVVKKFQDLTDIAVIFHNEMDRYKKRALRL